MRNIALATLRQLGFRGRVVAAALGLTENYVATLSNAARREGSAALVRQDRRGTPGKVTSERWGLARAWRAQGVSDAEIGRRLEVAHTTVSRALGPRGQAAGPAGEPVRARQDPLFSGPEHGPEPEAEAEPEAGPGAEPGAGMPPPGGRTPEWRPVPAAGVSWSRYAGAMLLHAFGGRAGAAEILASAAGRDGRAAVKSDVSSPAGRCPRWLTACLSVSAVRVSLRGAGSACASVTHSGRIRSRAAWWNLNYRGIAGARLQGELLRDVKSDPIHS